MMHLWEMESPRRFESLIWWGLKMVYVLLYSSKGVSLVLRYFERLYAEMFATMPPEEILREAKGFLNRGNESIR